MIEFTVLGRPQPAGSKRAFPIRKHGELTGRVAVADSNPLVKAWRQEVASKAHEALIESEHPMMVDGLLTGPLRMTVHFYFARPQSHLGTGRNASVVRMSAPDRPVRRPDLLKTTRGLEDALTGVVWRDDAQVVEQHAAKHYGAPERCQVWIEAL